MSYGSVDTGVTSPRATLPPPYWNAETAPYWRAAKEGRLAVPRCSACGVHRWPITYACYACLSIEWSFQPVPGTGTVFSYFWVDDPVNTDMVHLGLYNVAVIELDGTEGEPVRVPGWVVGTNKAALTCGLPVEVDFEPFDDEVAVPVWKVRARP